jgi:hypothetical protein
MICPKNHKAGLVGPAFLPWNWSVNLVSIAGQNINF